MHLWNAFDEPASVIPVWFGAQSGSKMDTNKDMVMWIFRWIFGAGCIIVGIGFAMQNSDQLVTVSLLHWKSQETPLWVVLYLTFAVGVLFWLIVSMFQALSIKTENQRIVKETKRLKEELDRLRNISIEEAMAFLDARAAHANLSKKE
jgi:uncharacterized integral membrane protein